MLSSPQKKSWSYFIWGLAQHKQQPKIRMKEPDCSSSKRLREVWEWGEAGRRPVVRKLVCWSEGTSTESWMLCRGLDVLCNGHRLPPTLSHDWRVFAHAGLENYSRCTSSSASQDGRPARKGGNKSEKFQRTILKLMAQASKWMIIPVINIGEAGQQIAGTTQRSQPRGTRVK